MKSEFYYDEEACCYRDVPQFKYPNKDELLKIFPEAKDIIHEKLKEALSEKKHFIDFTIKPYLKKIRAYKNDFARWFYKEVLKAFTKVRLNLFNANILRLQRLNNLTSGNSEYINIPAVKFKASIERAKQAPILEIINQVVRLRKGGRNYVGCCPFHQDKNPSFYVYPESNSFYCFGCQKSGDVINFVQSHYGYDFKQAVKYLTGGI